MNPDRWARAQEIFVDAIERDPASRPAFVEEAAAGDRELRDEVLSLIESHEQASRFIERGVVPDGAVDLVWSEREQPPTPTAALEALVGTVVGDRYRVDGLLGAGGMGAVFRATQMNLDRPVALKILLPGVAMRPESFARFQREALAVARLHHPNIVAVYDFGTAPDTGAYLVMELAVGRPLREELRRDGRIAPPRAVEIARQVLSAVQAAHDTGVVHRDLKPANVFVDDAAEGRPTVKVLDFGIAKLQRADGDLTDTGVSLGTPAYMAPEQCEGNPVDGRADVYAIGSMLYEMLSGRQPFEADTSLALMYKKVNGDPEPLARIAPGVPEHVAATVMRMLARRPEDRFGSAAESARALAGERDLGAAAAAGSRRGPVWAVAALGGVLAIGAGARFLARPEAPTPPPPSSNANTPAPQAAPEGFELIPGGTVVVGRDASDPTGEAPGVEVAADESPAHAVTLGPFYLARNEVTNREYQEFVSATGHAPPKSWRGTFPLGTDGYPVTGVSWEDATTYCAWRAERDHVAVRLPAEAEWEYAARGGDARLFPWGSVWNETFANANRSAGNGSPLPIDQPPNSTTDKSPFGVLAMAGNVSEWTASTFAVYPGSRYTPKGSDLASKVLRGGSYNLKPNSARVSYRNWQLASFTAPDVGFRLAATPSRER